MKKFIFGMMSAVVLLGLASCSDEDLVKIGAAKAGQMINFSIDRPSTRTVYETDEPLQIDWIKGDQISIFCDQAEGAKSAVYSITPTDADHITAQETSKYGLVDPNEEGLRWNGALLNNPGLKHNFYAVYPADVATCDDRGFADFTINTNQVCEITTNLKSDGTTAPITGSNYVSVPDMKNAYMVAADKNVTADQDKVNLVFAPVMTTLNITVTATSNGSSNDSVSVTGVSVTIPEVPTLPLGDDNKYRFRYRIGENSMGSKGVGSIVGTGSGISNRSISIFSGIRFTRVTGSTKEVFNSIPLASGQSVTLTVFLPPIVAEKMAEAEIRVRAEGGSFAVIMGSANDAKGEGVAPGSKRNVIFPNISVSGSARTNEWISELNDDIYINQLSIPGTNNSAANKSFAGLASSQSLELVQQWKSGVRAFEFRTNVANNLLGLTYGSTEVVCYDNGTNLQKTFDEAMTELTGLLNQSPDEFAIVILSYTGEHPGGLSLSQINTAGKDAWLSDGYSLLGSDYKGIKAYINKWANLTNSRGESWFVDFKPDMTIGDARGHIILLNYDEYGEWKGALVDGASTPSDAGSSVPDFTDPGTTPHKVSYRSGGQTVTSTSGLVYIQNLMAGTYVSDANKQAKIKSLDDIAVGIPQSSDFIWVINYVGGANASETADYRVAASANNKYYNDWLSGLSTDANGSKRADGPTGIVLVSHQGQETVKWTTGTWFWEREHEIKVYGANLPQTIINNNFKFPLKRKPANAQ